jgi:hypothetical protein
MSQQEFERRGQGSDEDIYQPQYPYAWSDQSKHKGMPRDEPPSTYNTTAENADQSNQRQNQGYEVPWWARPQPRQLSTMRFLTIMAVLILLVLITGGMGITGVVLGSIGHLLGILLGAILVLLLFFVLFIFLILFAIGRVMRGIMRPWQRTWRDW